MATATASKQKTGSSKTTTVRPLEDRVLVRPAAAETKTASGIFLPESAKEKPLKGEVIAVGPGKLNDKGERTTMSVKKGDSVLYGKYSGTEVEVDGEDYIILRESELHGVIED